MVSVSSGLDGVVVAETELSDVDGERGELIVRGYDIEELVGSVSFEDIVALLWCGRLPNEHEREEWRVRLAQARTQAFAMLHGIDRVLDLPDAMDALRGGLASMSSSGVFDDDAVSVAGAAPVFVAAAARRRAGRKPIAPDPTLSHAADYLRMIIGMPADTARAHALDAYLVCVADHGLNASTLAARVVASTGSDLVSAVVAGVGALKGPLHGGAPGPVLDMLDAIRAPERTRAWLDGELSAGRRIMGMGHRIYRVRDPRAAALERVAASLNVSGAAATRLQLARSVEREAEAVLAERHPDRPLRANVEFYTAVLLEAVGVPRELFSATFAVGRIAGWSAHFEEQRRRGRLMRPQSNYVGRRTRRPHDAH
jgi:citrate synthase